MAWVETRITRTNQPQDAVGIDWNNPLARRAKIALPMGGHFTNAVNGRPVTNNGNVGFSCAPNGIVANIINPAYLSVPSADYRPPTDQFTYAISVTTTSHDGVQSLFSAWDGPSSGRNIYAAINASSIQFDIPYKQAIAFFTAPPVGLHHYIFTVYNGVGSVYVDGKHFASTAISTTIETPANPLFIGRNSTNADNLNGTINNVFVSPDGFSAKMAAELYANQWQIYEPEVQRIWVDSAASVSLPTLVQPNATTSAGAWTATGAASLHAAINEATASAAEYISVNSASTTELVMAESAHPGAANQTLAYRASSTQGSTLTVTLKQGATQIMTRTHALTGIDTLYTQTLTAPEIASIVAGPISCTLTTS